MNKIEKLINEIELIEKKEKINQKDFENLIQKINEQNIISDFNLMQIYNKNFQNKSLSEFVFEKIFEGYNGNPLLALIIGLFSSFLIITNFYKENDKEYVSYGIETRKKFEENFKKVSDEVKYRTDIQDKAKYINLIFNKFYGNVDISIKDEELLKKLKR